MLKEAIILAGGLGTRLRNAVPDLPKCMAPVAGRPFLFYVINYLRLQGIEKIIFSLGYKHELIEAYLHDQFSTLSFQCVIEDEPLGTGGAIALACKKATEENVVIVNGDTIFKVDLRQMEVLHHSRNASATLALKPMKDFDRYGTVTLNDDYSIQSFNEKQFCREGIINGGVYLLNVRPFMAKQWPEKFSFEKDFLESNDNRLYGNIQDGYFIDIGIPEDYDRAQRDLKRPALELEKVSKDWTLFIDRDGVINHEKKGDYIRNWDEFVFYDGVKEALASISNKVGRIIIVSNQRGVGKGLMTESDLVNIHQQMKREIELAGGRLDQIYYCTSVDPKHSNRKPNPGMIFQAITDFKEIVMDSSIMIGNKPSDMLFGRNAGVYTVFIRTTNPDQAFPHGDIDLAFDSLADFAKALP